MALSRATQPSRVKSVTITILSDQAGRGKSSVASSSNSLFLNCDGDRIATTAQAVDSIPIKKWQDALFSTDPEAMDLLKEKTTLVIDTIGGLVNLACFFIKKGEMLAIGESAQMTIRNWVPATNLMMTYLHTCQLHEKDIIMLGHSKVVNVEGANILIPVIAGAAIRNTILQQSTAIGCLYWIKEGSEEYRACQKLSFLGVDYKPYGHNGYVQVLDFCQSSIFTMGKNPGRYAPLLVPDLRKHSRWMEDMKEDMKEKINAENELKASMRKEALELVKSATTAKAYDKLLQDIGKHKQTDDVKFSVFLGEIMASAKAKGIFYSTEKKCFIGK